MLSFICFLFLFIANIGISDGYVQYKANAKGRSMGGPHPAYPYHGEWDITAKETASLCEAIKHSGTNHSLAAEMPEPKKSSYLREGGECWKYAWIPCQVGEGQGSGKLGEDDVLAKRRRPCGHYKMVSAPQTDCH